MKETIRTYITSAFVTNRLYMVFGGLVAWFVITSIGPSIFFYFGVTGLAVLLLLLLEDYRKLYLTKGTIRLERNIAGILSLGNQNPIKTTCQNLFNHGLRGELIDHLPKQLQARNFSIKFDLDPNSNKLLTYWITPLTRGIYEFGDPLVFVQSPFPGLLKRKYKFDLSFKAKVYPSVMHMREMELKSFSKLAVNQGVKRIRRIGHSYEFEQIKTYVQGDDYRSINWKATGRRQSLMINQYEDERSQPIYFVIDKGRNMKMPFNGLSLVDYAVNSTLAISNVAMQKGDKVGLLTFDTQLGRVIKAGNKKGQLTLINEALYDLQQSDTEPDFDNLYAGMSFHVKQRSLMFLYTNCNTLHSLQRIKSTLQMINKRHLLVVIMFENTEISQYAAKKPGTLEQVYEQTVAEEFLFDQRQIAAEFNAHGIQTIVSAPNELSVATLNKYLELKSRGKI